jgi:hypothetical protein
MNMKETASSIRQHGKRIWRGKCVSDPQLLAALIHKRAAYAWRVVFETGPLSVWFYHSLTAEGLPAICIDARHAKPSCPPLTVRCRRRPGLADEQKTCRALRRDACSNGCKNSMWEGSGRTTFWMFGL